MRTVLKMCSWRIYSQWWEIFNCYQLHSFHHCQLHNLQIKSSLPHTRTGMPYTPAQQLPPPQFFSNKPIWQPSVSTQQQQNVHQNLQQMHQQNYLLQSKIQSSGPTVPVSNFKSQGGHFSSPNKSGMDHALVAKINKVHTAVFNETHRLDAMSLKED